MMKMLANKIYTNKDGGEYLTKLEIGDVFFSFHHSSQSCLAVFVKEVDLNSRTLDLIFSDLRIHFSNKLNELEVKVISTDKSFEKSMVFLEACNFQNIKKISRNEIVEVWFLPSINKVRVASVNNVLPIHAPKISINKEPSIIKVLIVDDSKAIRTILSKVFSSDPMFEVCAMAERPSEVEALIIKHKPDVITLDIHMPEMDGVTLLKTIIGPKYHIPTVMISSISMAEGPMVLDALENGAVDYIQKPEMSELANVTPLILEKVRIAAMANMNKSAKNDKSKIVQSVHKCNLDALIVLGASTGGTEAIREILTALPSQIPPMLIVQHIPAVFSLAFAKRMNDLCSFNVKEAEDGDEVKINQVLIAPGGTQMKLIRKEGKTFVEINDDEPVNRFKPSVDYMFSSVAKSLYTHTIAIILTGMGKDGAKGMLELKNLGVRTIAQNEESSVVFGMPREAINIGAAEFIEPLNQIAEKIIFLSNNKKKNREVS